MRINKIFWLFILASSLSSCLLRKEYARDKEIIDQTPVTFRSVDGIDTVNNLADLSWREFFKDSVLRAYIDSALINNYDVRIAIQNINAAEAMYKQGKAVNTPTVNFGLNPGFFKPTQNGQFGTIINTREQYDANLALTWEADLWGKLKGAKVQSYQNLIRSYDVQQAILSTMVSNIATFYYQLIAYDKQEQILKQTIASRKENVEVTRDLYDAGEYTLAAVKRTEALLYNSQGTLVNIEKNILLTENTLSLLLGNSADSVHRSSTFTENFDFNLKVGIPYSVLENRPDVRAAERQLMSNFEGVNIARASMYPSLTFSFSTGFQSISVESWFTPSSFLFSVLGSLSQPIWNKRVLKTNYEVSQIARDSSFLRFKYIILKASNEVSGSIITIDKQTEQIERQEMEKSAYLESLSYSKDLLLYGSVNYLEVITAKQDLLSIQLLLVDNNLIKVNEYIKLYKALGGGWR